MRGCGCLHNVCCTYVCMYVCMHNWLRLKACSHQATRQNSFDASRRLVLTMQSTRRHRTASLRCVALISVNAPLLTLGMFLTPRAPLHIRNYSDVKSTRFFYSANSGNDNKYMITINHATNQTPNLWTHFTDKPFTTPG